MGLIHHWHHARSSHHRFLSWRFVLFAMAGAAMVGQASRMIYQGLFQPNAVYAPKGVDLLFDWATLLLLGVGLLGYTFFTLLHRHETS